MDNIQLMLVDDHDVVRTGIKTLLEGYADLEVVAEATDGKAAIEQLGDYEDLVILMDISMPEVDGMEATREIKRLCPECQVLALTVHEDKQFFFEMLAAGASGYLTKRAAPEELVAAIRAVAGGNVYLQPTLARWLLDDYQRVLGDAPQGAQWMESDEQTGGLALLTEREKQVIELVADGLTSTQIGEVLGISPKTVSRHRERIMNKLDLRTCPDLVKFAIRTGLIDLD